MSIITEKEDASILKSKIESLGCSVISISQNRVMARRNSSALLNLAKSSFVKYLELGALMSGDSTNSYLE